MPASICIQIACDATARGVGTDPDLLHSRVAEEFHELPGLMLTLAQAARLFDLNLPDCERVLRALVDAGVLATDGRMFHRADARVGV